MAVHPVRRLLVALVPLAALVVGCGVAADEIPRDIDAAGAVTAEASPSADLAEGSGRIYLTTTSGDGRTTIVSVARDVEGPQGVIDALLAGPNADELAAGFRSELPPGLRATVDQRRGGNLAVADLSDEITGLSGNSLVVALAQIVYTLSELQGVDSVLITVEGSQTQWPDGDGTLQSQPLTVYDYPSLEPSSQPPYPAVPSQ